MAEGTSAFMKLHFQPSKPKPYTKRRLVRELNKVFRQVSAHALLAEDDATKSEMIEDLRRRIVLIVRHSKGSA